VAFNTERGFLIELRKMKNEIISSGTEHEAWDFWKKIKMIQRKLQRSLPLNISAAKIYTVQYPFIQRTRISNET